MTFRWLSIQIKSEIYLVGVQKLELNCLKEWFSRIKKKNQQNFKYLLCQENIRN